MDNQPINRKPKKTNIGCAFAFIVSSFLFLAFVIVKVFVVDPAVNKQFSATSIIQPSQDKPAFEVLSSNMKTEDGIRYVTGRIQNNTNKIYSYVQVEINLYDLNDNFIDSTIANVNNFEPSTVWYFKALARNEKAKKFKIMNISWLD